MKLGNIRTVAFTDIDEGKPRPDGTFIRPVQKNVLPSQNYN